MSTRICRARPSHGADLCPSKTDAVHPADLHAWASGDLRLMAAVLLLDDSGLLDHEWTQRFIGPELTFVDFAAMGRALPRSPLSGGERAIAQAAVSLTEGLKIDLGAVLLALDPGNIDTLVTALDLFSPPTRPRPTHLRALPNPLAVGA